MTDKGQIDEIPGCPTVNEGSCYNGSCSIL